jgi:cytidylate kinase
LSYYARKEYFLVNNSVDWNAIKAEYIAGGIGYRRLAEKHGVSFGTLSKIAMRENWTDLRKKACEKTGTVLAETIGKRNAKKSAKIDMLVDMLLDRLAERMDALLVEGKDVKSIASALKDLREIKGIKTEADIREQNARIKNLERQIAADGAESKPITVVLAGDTDKYSK